MGTLVMIRVQLNLPALERLIGGDTEIEVELRRQVVANFAKHYLEGVLDAAALKAVGEEVRSTVRSAVLSIFGQHTSSAAVDSATSAAIVEKSLDKKISDSVNDYIDRVIADRIERHSKYYCDRVQVGIERSVVLAVDRIIDERIREAVSCRITDIVHSMLPVKK